VSRRKCPHPNSTRRVYDSGQARCPECDNANAARRRRDGLVRTYQRRADAAEQDAAAALEDLRGAVVDHRGEDVDLDDTKDDLDSSAAPQARPERVQQITADLECMMCGRGSQVTVAARGELQPGRCPTCNGTIIVASINTLMVRVEGAYKWPRLKRGRPAGVATSSKTNPGSFLTNRNVDLDGRLARPPSSHRHARSSPAVT
jgi:hypothetical protein